MPDFSTLNDAFRELERRADALPVHNRPGDELAARRRTRTGPISRTVVASSAAVVVAGIAVGVAFATSDGPDSSTPAGGPRAASSAAPGPTTASSAAPSAPGSSAAPPVARSSAPSASSAPGSTSAANSASSTLPDDASQLAARLRAVLGDTATFTYSAPAGAKYSVIQGVLTNTKTSARGGFDLQTNPGQPGDGPICEDADQAHCVTRQLTDGAVVSIGRETLQQGGGTLYLVNLVRKNGDSLLMHVSSQRDPKGGSESLSSTPPLTRDQIVTILDSSRW